MEGKIQLSSNPAKRDHGKMREVSAGDITDA
jgi:hypothetical protein